MNLVINVQMGTSVIVSLRSSHVHSDRKNRLELSHAGRCDDKRRCCGNGLHGIGRLPFPCCISLFWCAACNRFRCFLATMYTYAWSTARTPCQFLPILMRGCACWDPTCTRQRHHKASKPHASSWFANALCFRFRERPRVL